MFHDKDGLFFARAVNGDVTITKTSDGKEPAADNVIFSQVVDKGTWCSVVLSMTAFNERPGDWGAWLKHHNGEEDILAGKRGGY